MRAETNEFHWMLARRTLVALTILPFILAAVVFSLVTALCLIPRAIFASVGIVVTSARKQWRG